MYPPDPVILIDNPVILMMNLGYKRTILMWFLLVFFMFCIYFDATVGYCGGYRWRCGALMVKVVFVIFYKHFSSGGDVLQKEMLK